MGRTIEAAREILDRAIADRVFPAAVVDVGTSAGPTWQQAFGALTFDATADLATVETPFDLASLTKVIATTSVLMDLVRLDAIGLDEPLADCFDDWGGLDRELVTVRDLLEHASGLPARLVDAPPRSRRELEHDIGTIRLEYVPRTRSIYSDLGFILLGFLASDRGRSSLERQFDVLVARLASEGYSSAPLAFTLPPEVRQHAAPTLPLPDDPRRGRALVGEVHDSYAAALGGVAGHAGVFGTASGVGVFARAVLLAARGDQGAPPPFSPALVRRFTTRSEVGSSSRALGWDTMLPTSSCGTRMSTAAFGHVGFTGTSLWIDPDRDRYFALLTNRACGGGSLEDMRAVRRMFHDALGDL